MLAGHGTSAVFQARLQARIPPSSDTAFRPRARRRSAASMLVFPLAHTATTGPPFDGWKSASALASPRRSASYTSACTLPGIAHSARSAAGRTSTTVTAAPRSSSSRRASLEIRGGVTGEALNLRSRLARVVFRIHVGDAPGPDAVKLEDDTVASGPGVVNHLLRHHGVAAGRKRHAARIAGLLAHSDVQRPGEHGHVLENGVPVRRYPVVWREPESQGEWDGLGRVAFEQGELGAAGQGWRAVGPADARRMDNDGTGRRSGSLRAHP